MPACSSSRRASSSWPRCCASSRTMRRCATICAHAGFAACGGSTGGRSPTKRCRPIARRWRPHERLVSGGRVTVAARRVSSPVPRAADRLRAVLVLPAAPLPFGDTAARWFHLLARDLLGRGHEVSCLTVSDEPAAKLREAYERLSAGAPAGRLRFQAFPLRSPVPPARRKLRNAWRPFSELYHAPGFRPALRAELARGYDVLHLEQLWSGWAGLGLPRALLNVHHLEIIDLEDARGGTFSER